MTTTNQLRSLISDDAFAMQFQSMGQYRNALLKSIDQAGRSEAQGEPCKEFGLPLDFSKPLETIDGRPVEYVGNGVIEYECARVCVDQDTGVVYSSPYHGLRIRNVKSAGSAEQVSERELASMLVAFANDDSIPKLDDDEIRAICQSRGWTPTDTPSLRELAHVFYAEGCAAQRRALQHTAPAPSKAGEWTDEQILKLADDFGIDYDGSFYRNPDEDKANFLEFARALLSAPAQAQSEDARDAARYRWLTEHAYIKRCLTERGEIFLVGNVERKVPVDDSYPSVSAAIDAAMSTTPSEKEPT